MVLIRALQISGAFGLALCNFFCKKLRAFKWKMKEDLTSGDQEESSMCWSTCLPCRGQGLQLSTTKFPEHCWISSGDYPPPPQHHHTEGPAGPKLPGVNPDSCWVTSTSPQAPNTINEKGLSYLSVLLSAAPLEIIKNKNKNNSRHSTSHIRPSERPKQYVASLFSSGPRSRTQRTLKGRSLGGKGKVRPLPPTAGLSAPPRGWLHGFIQRTR